MSFSSADIKRQILLGAKESPVKKRMDKPEGISEGEIIEIGNALESVTKMPGWTMIESYMIRRMNLIGLVMGNQKTVDPDQKGVAKGYMELMQWIEIMVSRRNEILEKERREHGKAETVSEEEGKQAV